MTKSPSEMSQAELLSRLTPEDRDAFLAQLTEEQTAAMRYEWRFWARPKQLPPSDGELGRPWATWLILAGRGFGKTRAGAGWFHERAMEYAGRWMALVAYTPADARDYCVEGPGGLLRNTPPGERPTFEPSKRRLSWPNGSWATIYSDQEPDQLRGFSGDTAWVDELGKFTNGQDTWDNLQFGMREASSDRPRRLVTTTPRPVAIIRKIKAMPGTVTVVGSSHENRSNLDPDWFQTTIAAYEGTRFGRQEIYAHILDDVPGALWTPDTLDRGRVKPASRPDVQRIVVGVDPSGHSGNAYEKADSIGIVVAGRGFDGHGYVLGDFTCSLSPDGWGRRVIEAYRAHSADRIVAERNYGGAMVEHVIRCQWLGAPIKLVTSSRGKVLRAEPIAALYEQGRVHHVGEHRALEDQMVSFRSDGYAGEGSPDRVDALVFALTELMLGNREMVQSSFVGLY